MPQKCPQKCLQNARKMPAKCPQNARKMPAKMPVIARVASLAVAYLDFTQAFSCAISGAFSSAFLRQTLSM
jgi:hypothetical protein